VEVLAKAGRSRIERIVSTGQVTPDGQWYDEASDEWVLLVSGEARLRIERESEARQLRPGDWLFLPAHCRHRVTWTSTDPPAIWLAAHIAPE
jgi:cupin 2 domain-containing protein